MSELGDLIAVGLLAEPNGLGLTASQAHEIGERIAARVPVEQMPESEQVAAARLVAILVAQLGHTVVIHRDLLQATDLMLLRDEVENGIRYRAVARP